MANLGEYRPPNQINKDEDKYWKLTKVQIGYLLVGLFLGIGILNFLSMFQIVFLKILGWVILFLLLFGCFLLGTVPIPNEKYLKGGGLRLDQYLFRLIKKRMKKNRVIYTRYIDDSCLYKKQEQTSSILDNLKSLFS